MNHNTLFSGWLFIFSVCFAHGGQRTTSRGGVSLFLSCRPQVSNSVGLEAGTRFPAPHCILSICSPSLDTCLCPVSGNWRPHAWAHLLALGNTFQSLPVKRLLCRQGDLSLNRVEPCLSVPQPRGGRDGSSLVSRVV